MWWPGKQQMRKFAPAISTTRTNDAAFQGGCGTSEIGLNPRLISQSLQFTKVTINSQYFQAHPPRRSNRVALSYRLIKCTLSRPLMLEPICLTPPPPISIKLFIFNNLNCKCAFFIHFHIQLYFYLCLFVANHDF